jgi:hypothetical protein
MKTPQFEIFAPLQNFCWSGDDLELTQGLWIRHFHQKPDLRGLDAELAPSEQSDIGYLGASHWLTFHWNEGSELCPTETVNLVLIALWLAKPTASHVAFRFKLGQGESADKKGVSRLYDRFAWPPDDAQEKFADPAIYKPPNHSIRLCAIFVVQGEDGLITR